MDRAAFAAYERALVDALRGRSGVLGLVAVGSFATGADEFSDHDFVVIAEDEAAEPLRNDRSWLPSHERIAFAFRETAHGVKAVYDDGHLVEFAVFTLDELPVARLNRTRVLFDHADVAARIAQCVSATTDEVVARRGSETDAFLAGQFLTALLVGVKRHRRGERLAGVEFVHAIALRLFLLLLVRHVPPERPGNLDDLNPFRRVELAYPSLAAELDALVATGDLERTATGLLDMAERLFADLTRRDLGLAAWSTIRRAITA